MQLVFDGWRLYYSSSLRLAERFLSHLWGCFSCMHNLYLPLSGPEEIGICVSTCQPLPALHRLSNSPLLCSSIWVSALSWLSLSSTSPRQALSVLCCVYIAAHPFTTHPGVGDPVPAGSWPLFISPLYAVHSEHEGCAGEDVSLLWLSRPLPPWNAKEQPCGRRGVQLGHVLRGALTVCRLLAAARPPAGGRSLPPVQQKQQEERLSSFRQPGLPPGFSLPVVEPHDIDSGRGARHWRHPDTLSTPSDHQEVEGVARRRSGDVIWGFCIVVVMLCVRCLKMSFWWNGDASLGGFLCSVSCINNTTRVSFRKKVNLSNTCKHNIEIFF